MSFCGPRLTAFARRLAWKTFWHALAERREVNKVALAFPTFVLHHHAPLSAFSWPASGRGKATRWHPLSQRLLDRNGNVIQSSCQQSKPVEKNHPE
jgi:hypothetical protein